MKATKLRLAEALESLNDPKLEPLITRVRLGFYSDYESPLSTPKVRLAREVESFGHRAFASAIRDGDFDDTAEEAEKWFQAEGRFLVADRQSHKINTDGDSQVIQTILTSLMRTYQACIMSAEDVTFADAVEALIRFLCAVIEDIERRAGSSVIDLFVDALKDFHGVD